MGGYALGAQLPPEAANFLLEPPSPLLTGGDRQPSASRPQPCRSLGQSKLRSEGRSLRPSGGHLLGGTTSEPSSLGLSNGD